MTFFTPPQIAKRLRVRGDKVLNWIRKGELCAVNVSDSTRPRYRVSEGDLATFLDRRSVDPQPRVERCRRPDYLSPDDVDYYPD